MCGCATNDNPREGGFFGGIAGLSSGAYEERLKQREQYLAQQRDIGQNLQQDSRALKHDRQKLEQEFARLAAIDKGLSKLQAAINQLKNKSDKQKEEISALNHKVVELRKKIRFQQTAREELQRMGGSTKDSVSIKILEKERDQLALEYTKLMKYNKAQQNVSK